MNKASHFVLVLNMLFYLLWTQNIHQLEYTKMEKKYKIKMVVYTLFGQKDTTSKLMFWLYFPNWYKYGVWSKHFFGKCVFWVRVHRDPLDH